MIEDPQERIETLRNAWNYAEKLLIVSARLTAESDPEVQKAYQDGYLTQKNTFQKYYTQQELRDWIDETLDVSSVPAAPGVFFVFRDEAARQLFAASRYRRTITRPAVRPEHLLEEQRELLQSVIEFATARGRLPDATEMDEGRITELVAAFGSLSRAFKTAHRLISDADWQRVRTARAQDLLVYLALARFGKRPRFSELPNELQLDIKAFYRSYRHACEVADELLFSAGDMAALRKEAKNASCGKRTREALYIHVGALPELPPLLRVYEGCASAYIGHIEGANVVKLNLQTARISYLLYPEFEKDPHPALYGALTVSLDTLDVRYRDYSQSVNPPILHRKETFLAKDHPLREKFERLTQQEERWGLYEEPQRIGTRNGWNQVLLKRGVRLAGHRLLRRANRRGEAS